MEPFVLLKATQNFSIREATLFGLFFFYWAEHISTTKKTIYPKKGKFWVLRCLSGVRAREREGLKMCVSDISFLVLSFFLFGDMHRPLVTSDSEGKKPPPDLWSEKRKKREKRGEKRLSFFLFLWSSRSSFHHTDIRSICMYSEAAAVSITSSSLRFSRIAAANISNAIASLSLSQSVWERERKRMPHERYLALSLSLSHSL